MTDTIRERIIAALETKYSQISTIAGLIVERNRDTPVQEFPTLVIIDGQQSPSYDDTGITRYDMEVFVEGYVRAASNDLGTANNALYGAVLKKTMEDITLGGLCFDIRERDMLPDINRNEGEKPEAGFSLLLSVSYLTKEGDPFSLPS